MRADGKNARELALIAIQRGEVVLFPTETVYGLGVDSAQPPAIEQLYALKGRPREKPFQWLIADVEMARARSKGWNGQAEKLAQTFWPGPLTIVVPVREGTIGWRMPRHAWLLELLKRLGRPLVATSANHSGAPAAKSCGTALKPFGPEISLAVDGGVIKAGKISTVVFVEGSNVRILRKGAISKAEISRVVKDI